MILKAVPRHSNVEHNAVPLSSNLTVMVMPLSASSHLELHSLHLDGVPVQLPPNDGGKQEPCTEPLYEELRVNGNHARVS